MDHGKILKFVRNKTFYFFFHKQNHFISNSNCKKIKHPERKMLKKKKTNCYYKDLASVIGPEKVTMHSGHDIHLGQYYSLKRTK